MPHECYYLSSDPENPHKTSGAGHILVILGIARQEAEMEACGPASLADMAKLQTNENPCLKNDGSYLNYNSDFHMQSHNSAPMYNTHTYTHVVRVPLFVLSCSVPK